MNQKFGSDFLGAKERNTIRNKIHNDHNIKAILTIQKKKTIFWWILRERAKKNHLLWWILRERAKSSLKDKHMNTTTKMQHLLIIHLNANPGNTHRLRE